METRANSRKFLSGTVVSDKMDKTRIVQVNWMSKHSKYHKPVRRKSKFKAHDEKNEFHVGDVVKIMETRRLSKDKRWVILETIKK